MDAETPPEISGKILQNMILGPKFGALPLDIRRRFSQNYNAKVTSPYEAAWAIIYGSNIEFESTLVLDAAPGPAHDKNSESSVSASFILSSDPVPNTGENSLLFDDQNEKQLFSELSKLKTFLVRFLEVSLRTSGSHLAELRLDIELFPNVDVELFNKVFLNSALEPLLNHIRRNNWYQIVPGKIGLEPLFETLLRAESAYPNPVDLAVWKDINTLLIDPGVRTYISIFYKSFIQNRSLKREKINEYMQTIENLPLNCVLM